MAGSHPCKHQGDTIWEDKISKLPDAILVGILSLLTIKEAGRTSVLSNRWLNLWKFTSHLNFDALPQELWNVQSAISIEAKKPLRSKYVTWVNQVLGSHECGSLDEFKVQFDLDASFSEDIDEWIKFMISKRATTMQIDLTPYFGTDIYCLSKECNDLFTSVSNLSNIMCLRSLTLGAVNVEGELIEYLVSKCPHLEILSISSSQKLFRLKISGPSLPLKYLKICRCDSLESLELCAPNLVTFSYTGKAVNFVFGSNPRLSELYIDGGRVGNVMTSCLPLFSRYFSQIETLTLRIFIKDLLELPHITGLKNLKHLIWEIGPSFVVDVSLIGLTKFMMAAPRLEKLTLEESFGARKVFGKECNQS